MGGHSLESSREREMSSVFRSADDHQIGGIGGWGTVDPSVEVYFIVNNKLLRKECRLRRNMCLFTMILFKELQILTYIP